MNENTTHFRGTAFGGFHRQDVLNHIERITREYIETTKEGEAQRAALAAQLEEAQAARRQAEDRLAQLEDQVKEAEAREQEALARQKALEEELDQLKNQLAQRDSALSQAQAESDQLRRRVDSLVPGAASWQRIKDTAGDIEVSAHERAQITIQEAQLQASEIKAQGIRWVLEIQACCDKLQRDLRTSILAAESELDAVRASFARTETSMEGFQRSLSDLVSSTEEPPAE